MCDKKNICFNFNMNNPRDLICENTTRQIKVNNNSKLSYVKEQSDEFQKPGI